LSQEDAPVDTVPCTRRTGGLAAVGLPRGQVRDAASVSELTVKGTSPLNLYVGAARRAIGEALTSERKRAVAIEYILSEGVERQTGLRRSRGL